MSVLLRAIHHLLENVAYSLVKGFRQTISRSIVHRRVMLFETELCTQLVHGCIVEFLSIIGYDVSWYPITVNDVCSDEVYNRLFLDLS